MKVKIRGNHAYTLLYTCHFHQRQICTLNGESHITNEVPLFGIIVPDVAYHTIQLCTSFSFEIPTASDPPLVGVKLSCGYLYWVQTWG